MEKTEAIRLMQEGKKITHRHFTDDEWMTMKDGKIHLEDGVICDPFEFWRWRKEATWKNGYSLWINQEVTTKEK